MKVHTPKTSLYKRSIAALTAFVFFVSILFFPSSYAAEPATVFQETSFPSQVAEIKLPPDLGEIETAFQGQGNELVIVVQDAHAIPSAQRSIEKIIRYFQNEYHLNIVALEGAASELDPTFFKSFPEREKLQDVFKKYYDRGEMTGSVAAAIFSKQPAVFHGMEDWALYENGLELYLRAMQKQAELLKALEQMEAALQGKKEKSYSKELLEIDRLLIGFHRNEADLLKVLPALAKIKAPPPQSEITLLLKQIEEQGDSTFELEVKRMAQEFEKKVTQAKTLKKFNQSLQAFKTSQLSAQDFALWMKEAAEKQGVALQASSGLSTAMRHSKRMRDLEGTELFRDLESYAYQAKASLFRSPKDKVLSKETKRLEVLRQLISLEVIRSDWDKLRMILPQLEKGFEPGALEDAVAFYENAIARDKVFFANVEKLMRQEAKGKFRASLLVAGGFHAQGLNEKLKAANISHLLIMPEIKEIPDETSYRDQMVGNVSWKKYFEVENGRINLYKAFLRGTRDQLLEKADKFLIKQWRDQIIRDLSKENRVQEAGNYTRFIDEVTPGAKPAGPTAAEQMAKVESFVAGLKNLGAANQLTDQNILRLLKPSTIFPTAGPQLANSTVPGGMFELTTRLAPRQARSRENQFPTRAEARTVKGLESQIGLETVQDVVKALETAGQKLGTVERTGVGVPAWPGLIYRGPEADLSDSGFLKVSMEVSSGQFAQRINIRSREEIAGAVSKQLQGVSGPFDVLIYQYGNEELAIRIQPTSRSRDLVNRNIRIDSERLRYYEDIGLPDADAAALKMLDDVLFDSPWMEIYPGYSESTWVVSMSDRIKEAGFGQPRTAAAATPGRAEVWKFVFNDQDEDDAQSVFGYRYGNIFNPDGSKNKQLENAEFSKLRSDLETNSSLVLDWQVYRDFKEAFLQANPNQPTLGDLLDQAVILASRYHAYADNAIRDDLRPYIVHPLEIAFRAVSVGLTDKRAVLAALFHDLLEDTEAKKAEEREHIKNTLVATGAITEQEYDDVLRMVEWLTEDRGFDREGATYVSPVFKPEKIWDKKLARKIEHLDRVQEAALRQGELGQLAVAIKIIDRAHNLIRTNESKHNKKQRRMDRDEVARWRLLVDTVTPSVSPEIIAEFIPALNREEVKIRAEERDFSETRALMTQLGRDWSEVEGYIALMAGNIEIEAALGMKEVRNSRLVRGNIFDMLDILDLSDSERGLMFEALTNDVNALFPGNAERLVDLPTLRNYLSIRRAMTADPGTAAERERRQALESQYYDQLVAGNETTIALMEYALGETSIGEFLADEEFYVPVFVTIIYQIAINNKTNPALLDKAIQAIGKIPELPSYPGYAANALRRIESFRAEARVTLNDVQALIGQNVELAYKDVDGKVLSVVGQLERVIPASFTHPNGSNQVSVDVKQIDGEMLQLSLLVNIKSEYVFDFKGTEGVIESISAARAELRLPETRQDAKQDPLLRAWFASAGRAFIRQEFAGNLKFTPYEIIPKLGNNQGVRTFEIEITDQANQPVAQLIVGIHPSDLKIQMKRTDLEFKGSQIFTNEDVSYDAEVYQRKQLVAPSATAKSLTDEEVVSLLSDKNQIGLRLYARINAFEVDEFSRDRNNRGFEADGRVKRTNYAQGLQEVILQGIPGFKRDNIVYMSGEYVDSFASDLATLVDSYQVGVTRELDESKTVLTSYYVIDAKAPQKHTAASALLPAYQGNAEPLIVLSLGITGNRDPKFGRPNKDHYGFVMPESVFQQIRPALEKNPQLLYQVLQNRAPALLSFFLEKHYTPHNAAATSTLEDLPVPKLLGYDESNPQAPRMSEGTIQPWNVAGKSPREILTMRKAMENFMLGRAEARQDAKQDPLLRAWFAAMGRSVIRQEFAGNLKFAPYEIIPESGENEGVRTFEIDVKNGEDVLVGQLIVDIHPSNLDIQTKRVDAVAKGSQIFTHDEVSYDAEVYRKEPAKALELDRTQTREIKELLNLFRRIDGLGNEYSQSLVGDLPDSVGSPILNAAQSLLQVRFDEINQMKVNDLMWKIAGETASLMGEAHSKGLNLSQIKAAASILQSIPVKGKAALSTEEKQRIREAFASILNAADLETLLKIFTLRSQFALYAKFFLANAAETLALDGVKNLLAEKRTIGQWLDLFRQGGDIGSPTLKLESLSNLSDAWGSLNRNLENLGPLREESTGRWEGAEFQKTTQVYSEGGLSETGFAGRFLEKALASARPEEQRDYLIAALAFAQLNQNSLSYGMTNEIRLKIRSLPEPFILPGPSERLETREAPARTELSDAVRAEARWVAARTIRIIWDDDDEEPTLIDAEQIRRQTQTITLDEFANIVIEIARERLEPVDAAKVEAAIRELINILKQNTKIKDPAFAIYFDSPGNEIPIRSALEYVGSMLAQAIVSNKMDSSKLKIKGVNIQLVSKAPDRAPLAAMNRALPGVVDEAVAQGMTSPVVIPVLATGEFKAGEEGLEAVAFVLEVVAGLMLVSGSEEVQNLADVRSKHETLRKELLQKLLGVKITEDVARALTFNEQGHLVVNRQEMRLVMQYLVERAAKQSA